MESEEVISKEVMQQYEEVRELGPCNMLDYFCVMRVGEALGYYALANLTKEDYIYLLKNFSRLMSLYGITQN